MACSRHTAHAEGDIIVHEGDPIESIIVVRSGRIKTFRVNSDGEEYVLDVLHDGQALWHGMFTADHVYRYSVECLAPVRLCRIHRADFEALLSNHPDVALGPVSYTHLGAWASGQLRSYSSRSQVVRSASS